MAEYDVAVVGAGPAGSATALRLARAGVRVLLLERSRFDEPRVGESLTPDVNPLLHDLGLTADLAGSRPSYGVRSFWGGEASSSTLSSPYGTGWYVDRAAFDRHLAGAAADAGADLRVGTACLDAVRGDGWALSLSGGEERTARVLVDATGRSARVGRRLDAERLAFDRLVAVTAFVPGDDGGFGLVETVADGWCYSAPAGSERLVVMMLTDADLGRDGLLITPDRWRAALGPETSSRLGDTEVSELRVVSAVSQRLHRRTVDAVPWLAVGDAAFATDPITGTGVVRALRGARAAADTVLSLLAGGPAGDYEASLDRECTGYLHRRRDYYAAETRWPHAPFWQRRSPSGQRP